MHHRWAQLALGLALCALSSRQVEGQGQQSPRGRKLGTLSQNNPNPFKTDTFIPFSIDDCEGPGGQRVVSLRIYNVLAQHVATPVLYGSDHPLATLRLSCGEYVAYWDGKVAKTGRAAAAGVYVYELVVDGQRSSHKMIVEK